MENSATMLEEEGTNRAENPQTQNKLTDHFFQMTKLGQDPNYGDHNVFFFIKLDIQDGIKLGLDDGMKLGISNGMEVGSYYDNELGIKDGM
eukprot:8664191-Ditylum_brightwellii.AAC.1